MRSIVQYHPALCHADAMRQICKPLIELGGIDYFSHVQIYPDQSFSGLALNPEFIRCYFEEKLYRFDSMNLESMPQGDMHILWDNVALSGNSLLLDDIGKEFGLHHTFTIIRPSQEHIDIFNFCAPEDNETVNAYYLSNQDKLHQFILFYREKLASCRQLSQAFEKKIVYSDEYSGFFVSDEAGLHHDINTVTASPDKKFYINMQQYLTRREVEILLFLSKGYSMEELTTLLDISYRTVRAHVEKAKECFDCENLFQLGVHFAKWWHETGGHKSL